MRISDWSSDVCSSDVPMVLEARGLDVTPATVDRFRAVGDEASARILERILRDEIRHVAAGTKWFESGCAENRFAPETHWQMLVEIGRASCRERVCMYV